MPPARAPSRDALIATALAAFGDRGRDGASTRDIATAAGMPMSQITYHFGGKDGLYLACAERIAETMAALIGPALDALDARPAPAGPPATLADRQSMCETLVMLTERLARAMLDDALAPMVRFLVREQAEPGPAFDIVYNGVMGRVLAHIAALIERIGAPRVDAAASRVRALALIGQVLVFRVARASVQRATGWERIGSAELALILATLRAHVEAVCDALCPPPSGGTCR